MKLSRHSFSPPIPNSSRSSSKESHQSPVDWPKEVSWYSFGFVATLPSATEANLSFSPPKLLETPSSSSSVRISSSDSWSLALPLLGSLLGGGGRGGGVRSVLVLYGRRFAGFGSDEFNTSIDEKVDNRVSIGQSVLIIHWMDCI